MDSIHDTMNNVASLSTAIDSRDSPTIQPTMPAPITTASPVRERIFLVIADQSREVDTALRFACERVKRIKHGRIALLTVSASPRFAHWAGVGRLFNEEVRDAAQRELLRLADSALHWSGKFPILHIREGLVADELLSLLNGDDSISVLVLATAANSDEPGPLISGLASKFLKRLRIPVTIVPGTLSLEDIALLT